MSNNPEIALKKNGKFVWLQLLNSLKQSLMQQLVGTITHVNTDEPVVALTFDDGPHKDFTPQVLKILKKHNAHATFFMVGQASLQYPEIVRQVYEEGHAIGNHTFNHIALPSINIWRQTKEIWLCRQSTLPYGSRLLRPPWGKQTNSSRLIAGLLGYKVICWNATAKDWLPHPSQSMAKVLANGLRPGSIILLHDRIFKSIMENPVYDRTETLEALDLLLTKTNGAFRFITIPQLLEYGKSHYVLWEQRVV